MTKTIEIIVSPAGKTKVGTKGFVGSGCREASRFIEQALGTKADEQLTAEFYQQAEQAQPVQQQGGHP